MTKRMLIDATHPEETRVAVVDGNRLEEFDYESIVRKQLKGGIYLAKVTRVEPSLQAAFVNFGGNRHGFLPFSEIHPDYYRLPVADREALIAEQEAEMEAQRRAEEEMDSEDSDLDDSDDNDDQDDVTEIGGVEPLDADMDGSEEEKETKAKGKKKEPAKKRGRKTKGKDAEAEADDAEAKAGDKTDKEDAKADKKGKSKAASSRGRSKKSKKDENEDVADNVGNVKADNTDEDDDNIGNRIEDTEEKADQELDAEINGNRKDGGGNNNKGRGRGRGRGRYSNRKGGRGKGRSAAAHNRKVEVVGGDGIEGDQPKRPALRKRYKIQEVVKRGQIMLIQVSKEERGNKGAAVTTYLSLPGRYCVLMPNSPRAGGVSRKIANYKERKRMRDVLSDLSIPSGMSVIMRTAGVQRTKTEIKRDLDYLMRLWNNIRDLTLSSSAPALIHEEANLIRRSIRDIYTRDVEEILAAGEDGHKLAKDFMKMMIPSHARRVKLYEDEQIPLFNRYQVESQIMEIGDPVVTLKSGGYLVINPTEALVSIDINSGRATKERHIEETALKTNLESAREIARQLRLRDLGGLVVIDFIDMEDRRNNRKVEKALRDALSSDRARIQVGRISNFGLLELSRQRLNPSLTEMQFKTCKHCEGVGYVRTTDNAAIIAMRALEEEGLRNRADEVVMNVSYELALYILNFKRNMMNEIEERYNLKVMIRTDDTLPTSSFNIEPVKKTDNAQDDEGEDSEKNKSSDDNNKQDGKSGRGGRRRGRRGGRNRSQNNRRDKDQNAESENADRPAEGTEPSDTDSEQAKDDKPKKSSRSRSRKKDDQTEKEADAPKDADVEDKKGGKKATSKSKTTKKADEKKDDKPKKTSAKTADDKKSDEKKSETESKAKGDKKSSAAKTKKAATKAPSNDTEPVSKDYEVVNETPDKKKKGWWNRLVD